MNKKIIVTSLSTLLISPAAQAIPPPDAVISIWQSLLQFLGVATVFIGGALFSVRQFFGYYIVGWKRVAFYIALGLGCLGLLWLMLGTQIVKADAEKPLAQGELVPIRELIKREDDDWLREWLLETVTIMQKEFNLARGRAGLPELTFGTAGSFSPKALNDLIKSQNKTIYVLDIREEYERARFGITPDGVARYGDLISNIIPQGIPNNALVVVLCHSGIRGYLGANLLKHQGFKRAAFLQGGLAAWNDQGFAVRGDPEYNAKKQRLLNKQEARTASGLKVQLDAEGSQAIRGIANVTQLPYETAATKHLQPVIAASKQQPVILSCNTYGGCFHSINFAWLIEQHGGKIYGIYDETGEHMSQFFDR